MLITIMYVLEVGHLQADRQTAALSQVCALGRQHAPNPFGDVLAVVVGAEVHGARHRRRNRDSAGEKGINLAWSEL